MRCSPFLRMLKVSNSMKKYLKNLHLLSLQSMNDYIFVLSLAGGFTGIMNTFRSYATPKHNYLKHYLR